MVGFSELQISQVLDNLERIFALSDIFEVVEIWDWRHAQQILSVINEIFKDIGDAVQQSYLSAEDGDNQYDFDEFLDQWNELLQDDELFDMIMENLSLSQLQLSLVDEEINGTSDLLEDGVPTAVLQTIKSMVMDDWILIHVHVCTCSVLWSSSFVCLFWCYQTIRSNVYFKCSA